MSAEFKGSDDFPVLLLRRQVAFPRVVVRVLVGRKRSLALLKHLQKQGKVGQKQPTFAAVTVKEPEVRTTAVPALHSARICTRTPRQYHVAAAAACVSPAHPRIRLCDPLIPAPASPRPTPI